MTSRSRLDQWSGTTSLHSTSIHESASGQQGPAAKLQQDCTGGREPSLVPAHHRTGYGGSGSAPASGPDLERAQESGIAREYLQPSESHVLAVIGDSSRGKPVSRAGVQRTWCMCASHALCARPCGAGGSKEHGWGGLGALAEAAALARGRGRVHGRRPAAVWCCSARQPPRPSLISSAALA